MKFKRGDIVTWTDEWPNVDYYHYVEDAYKTEGGQDHNLSFVTYFGQKVNVVVVHGVKYHQDNFKLVTSILREEE